MDPARKDRIKIDGVKEMNDFSSLRVKIFLFYLLFIDKNIFFFFHISKRFKFFI